MISIKTNEEIELMRKAGNILYSTHQEISKYIKPGITTNELNDIADEFIRSNDATPSFLGYSGFPKSICTSINEVVVHGIPDNTKLEDGDIVSIDIGVNYKGYHSDSAWTYKVGDISEDKSNLMKWTKEALYEGIKQVKPGNKVSDISKAIQAYASKHNLGIVKELVGHGVGSELHEEPEVPNYFMNDGPILKKGMTIAIEPMLNFGSSNVYISDDGWDIRSIDKSPSAHYEHTVLVTDDGYEILSGEW